MPSGFCSSSILAVANIECRHHIAKTAVCAAEQLPSSACSHHVTKPHTAHRACMLANTTAACASDKTMHMDTSTPETTSRSPHTLPGAVDSGCTAVPVCRLDRHAGRQQAQHMLSMLLALMRYTAGQLCIMYLFLSTMGRHAGREHR